MHSDRSQLLPGHLEIHRQPLPSAAAPPHSSTLVSASPYQLAFVSVVSPLAHEFTLSFAFSAVSYYLTLTVENWGESPNANLAHLETQRVSMEETGCHAKYVKHFHQIKQDTKGTF